MNDGFTLIYIASIIGAVLGGFILGRRSKINELEREIEFLKKAAHERTKWAKVL